MIKQEILDYVSTSPQNTNPAVLSTMLDSFAETVGGGSGGSGSGLPVVEFTTVAVAEETALTAEESAKLEELLTKEQPFIAKINMLNMFNIAAVTTVITGYGFVTAPVEKLQITMVNGGNGWIVGVGEG